MMQLQRSALTSQLASPRRSPTYAVQPARSVLARFQEGEKQKGTPTSGLSAEDEKKARNISDGSKLSPESANLKADLGSSWTNLGELQAFDGPAPETINNRLAMLGVVIALFWEARTGLGIREQIADHPLSVFAVFLTFTAASYIPILRGYTRKEAFSYAIFTPQAENWTGRIAQLGFLGMVITELVAGTNTLAAWGLDKLFR